MCVTASVATVPLVDIDALRALARLLRDAIPVSIAQDLGAALGSRDSNRRVAHATPTKTTSIRPIRFQRRAKSAKPGLASAIVETRHVLTLLMAHLILDQAARNRNPEPSDVRHDV